MATPQQPNSKSAARADRIPPHNIEVERSLLGALFLEKDVILKVADMLQADDFYLDAHSIIYQAMQALFAHQAPIDLVTVTNELEKKGKLGQIGGAAYLSNLVTTVPTAAHVVHYAEIVHHKATLRRLIEVASTIARLGYDEERDVSTVLDDAETNLFAVSQQHLKINFVPIKDILSQSFDRIDELHKNKGVMRGIPSGFKDLDNLLGGFQPSDLIIIAARPSIGKSSLALSIGLNAALEAKVPVGIFSLEMSREQVVDRLIAAQARVDAWKLRTGNLTDDDFPRINYAMGVLADAPLFIDDSPMLNVMDIRTKARRLQAQQGLGLIIIDYLQLMEGRSRASDPNRVQEVSEISRSLKGLARELDVPVLALSQLYRAVEQRRPQIPQLSDLRESGSIEQDADVVMFIYRQDYYERDTERKNIADILIKKHRNGPTGEVSLYFRAEQMTFENLAKGEVVTPIAEELNEPGSFA